MRTLSPMLVCTFSLLASLVAAAEPNQLTPQQVADGWINLFDGQTTFGWRPTSDADWRVEEGEIRVSKGGQGFLMTNSEFGDYELHVEFKAPATTNSGIFLRTPLAPTDPAKDCIELNIAPRDNPFPTASLVGRLRVRTAPEDVERSDGTRRRRGGPDQEINAWDGAWHAFDVVLKGPSVQISIDGVLLDSLVDKSSDPSLPLRGRIGLQFREGEVAFRNVRLKPLGLETMLNGKDLTGWNTKNVESSKFEVADYGELQVTGGRGILETDASYGDFIMQLDCFVNGDNLNSGVFFRSIPREYADGYESQIHNGMKDGDPTKPTDFGTGAIYRRIAARRIVAKDREWFTKTIVATGPHLAVWVNGYQVTDWTDERAPDDNPRVGRRTAPGTISLQGHDPTTNLRFRNLRIVELPVSRDAPAER